MQIRGKCCPRGHMYSSWPIAILTEILCRSSIRTEPSSMQPF
jgi:hypothetical protein